MSSSIRSSIESERQRTIARIASLNTQFDEFVEAAALSPPDDEHDPEGATIAFERAQISAMTEQAEHHLGQLDAALARLEAGTYGLCVRCEGQIGDERLLALPASATCVTCAARGI